MSVELPVTEGLSVSGLRGEGRIKEWGAGCKVPVVSGAVERMRRLSALVHRAPGHCRGDLPSRRCRQPILQECIRQQVCSCGVCAAVWCLHRGCLWEEGFLHGLLHGPRVAQKQPAVALMLFYALLQYELGVDFEC